jgi:AbiJ N-terminal domain 4
MRFSERMGIIPPKQIQTDSFDLELRASLWNLCRRYWFTQSDKSAHFSEDDMYETAEALYEHYYKIPVDELPYESFAFLDSQRKYFMESKWYNVLEFIEYLCQLFGSDAKEKREFHNNMNFVLEREKAGYRIIDGMFVPITNQTELNEIGAVLAAKGKFAPVSEHVKTALSLYSKKPDPDYRNSVKESISAIEAVSKIISNKGNASLKEALDEIDKRHSLHSAFKQGVTKLYGWTSDAGGIRHALTEAPNVDEADARFMLVSCSAFVNYLISRCALESSKPRPISI